MIDSVNNEKIKYFSNTFAINLDRFAFFCDNGTVPYLSDREDSKHE